MSAVYTAVAVGVGSLYFANEAGKKADKQFDLAEGQVASQNMISQAQVELAQEQWDIYKTKIMPMEIEAQQLGIDARQLAQQRGELDFDIYEKYYAPMSEKFATEAMEGVEAQPERAAREARLSVDQAFDTEEGMAQRNLQRRGVRPGSGSDVSGTLDTGLNRAAAKGYAVNRAVEHERDRVEDVNFNRKAVALGRQPLAQSAAQGGAGGISPGLPGANLAGAGNTAYGAGSQAASMGNAYANAAGNMVSGGIQLGTQAYDIYNKYAAPAGGGGTNIGFNPTSFNSYPAPAATGGGMDVGFSPSTMDIGYAEGGPVSAPPMLSRSSYAQGGQVNGPPGYDQVPAYIEDQQGNRTPTRLTENEYVIPSDVVKVIGTGPLDDIIDRARKRKEKSTQSPNSLSRRRLQ